MPDLSVPFLRSGKGREPADGGCVMQIADWIHSGGWSDHPECVAFALRIAAINVNDATCDDDRQKLLDFIPRLLGTNDSVKTDTNSRLGEFAAEFVKPILNNRLANSYGRALAVYARKHQDKGKYLDAIMYASSSAARAGRGIEFLDALLDEFDRITGHKASTDPVDFAPVCQMLAAASA